MNDSKRKFEKAFAWMAFLASYLLVWFVISMPTERQPDDLTAPKALIASLGVER